MTTREYFIKRFRIERPKFVSVISALPEDRLDYRPHQKNSAAGDIAWFLVVELRALVDLATTGENRWQMPPRPKSAAEIASEYEKTADAMESALASTDDAKWEGKVRIYAGDRLIKEDELGETLWDFFFDAIHHRGQLTAYLRPMGGKVPSTYGPSGDST